MRTSKNSASVCVAVVVDRRPPTETDLSRLPTKAQLRNTSDIESAQYLRNVNMYDTFPANFSYPTGSYPNFYNNYTQPLYQEPYQPRNHRNTSSYGLYEYNIPQEVTNSSVHGMSSCERVPPLSHPPQGTENYWAVQRTPAAAEYSTTLHHFPPTPPPSSGSLVLQAHEEHVKTQPDSVQRSAVSKDGTGTFFKFAVIPRKQSIVCEV